MWALHTICLDWVLIHRSANTIYHLPEWVWAIEQIFVSLSTTWFIKLCFMLPNINYVHLSYAHENTVRNWLTMEHSFYKFGLDESLLAQQVMNEWCYSQMVSKLNFHELVATGHKRVNINKTLSNQCVALGSCWVDEIPR